MKEPITPNAADLRGLAAKFGLDPRTVAKAILGYSVKGARTQEAAAGATAEWKKIKAKREKAKARTGP